MTREYFKTHTFDDVMEKLLYERNQEVTMLDTLKDFIKDTITKGQYYLSEHLVKALRNGNDEYYMLYDYNMGTLDTPVPINSLEDVEHLIDD